MDRVHQQQPALIAMDAKVTNFENLHLTKKAHLETCTNDIFEKQNKKQQIASHIVNFTTGFVLSLAPTICLRFVFLAKQIFTSGD